MDNYRGLESRIWENEQNIEELKKSINVHKAQIRKLFNYINSP